MFNMYIIYMPVTSQEYASLFFYEFEMLPFVKGLSVSNFPWSSIFLLFDFSVISTDQVFV